MVVLLCLCACRAPSLEQVEREVRRTFPAVTQLSTRALATWLHDSTREAPVLVDVREPAEFAVSHLPGARPQIPEAPLSDELLALDRETPIVAYCSVGYRSSRFAARLHEAGFSEVYNLEGSIFAWANEGRTVVRDGEPVDEVHPYNRRWGRLLDRRHRAESTPGGFETAVPVEAQ